MIVNSILRDNGSQEIFLDGAGSVLEISNSDVMGGWPGEGNIDADPLFMDPENGDFRLEESSPCIDSASTIGPVTDIDAIMRPVDIPGVGRDGTGDEYDMGAYERSASGNPTFTPTFTPTPTNTGTNTPTPTVTPTPKLLFVSDDAATGGDGRSWESAYRRIQDALDTTIDGDSVWVEAGSYNECLRMDQSVSLIGGFNGTESDEEMRLPSVNVCRLTPCTPSRDSLFVDGARPGPKLEFRVDGFVVEGSPRNLEPARAMAVRSASGVLQNLLVTNGHSKDLGGGLKADSSTLLIADCTFTENDALMGGGGLYLLESEVNLAHCSIMNNTAALGYNEAGVKGSQTPYWGGGILGEDSIIRATECLIENNDALSGGAICVFEASSELHLVSCSISNNSATNAAAMIGSTLEPISLKNCLVVRNDSRMENPGLWLDGQGEPVLIQYCTIADNSTSGPGGAIHSMDFKETYVENTILWGNTPDQLSGVLDLTEVTNSIIQGGYQGVGNLDLDPLFEDSLLGNYRLTRDSPAIDSGGFDGPAFDFEGNPRPVDSVGRGREGAGAFDIGAFEYQDPPTATPTITPTPSNTPTPTNTYPTDINLDGTVDAEDLLILLEDWGRVSGAR